MMMEIDLFSYLAKNKMDKRSKNKKFSENNFFLIKNRKGEKIISIYWFAILFIVAAAIVYMAALFYGDPYDIRALEADILTDKIAECFSKGAEGTDEGGYLNEEINQENFLQECDLTFDVGGISGSGEKGLYYVRVSVLEFGTEIIHLPTIKEGNANLKLSCVLSNGAGTLPYCLERSFYILDQEGRQYEINILSAVRNAEEDV